MKRIVIGAMVALLLNSTMLFATEELSQLSYEIKEVELNQPMGMCVDSEGFIYTVDSKDNVVVKLTASGSKIFAGDKSKKDMYGFPLGGLVDGPLTDAVFNGPRDIAYAEDGSFYIADTGNHVIRKIVDGEVKTMAGKGIAGYGDGKNNGAMFNAPSGITVSPEGEIVVADTRNNRIRIIDLEGNVSTMILSSKLEGDKDHWLNEPSDVCYDDNGILYILDSGNQQVKRVQDGIVEVVAGYRGAKTKDGYRSTGLVDGDANRARFTFPKSIAAYKGMVFVADTWNHCVRLIKEDGTIVTVAGNGEPGAEVAVKDSILNGPSGLLLKDDNLYIADKFNNRVVSVPLLYGSYEFDIDRALPEENRTDGIDVFVDDTHVDFGGVEPFMEDGRIYAPIRAFAESLGATVTYVEEIKEVFIRYGDKNVAYWIYDEATMIYEERLYIDVRELASHLGVRLSIEENSGDVGFIKVQYEEAGLELLEDQEEQGQGLEQELKDE